MRIRALLLCLSFAASGVGVHAQTPDQNYKLLLTPQRLRRLQRDRERKTVRWQNFERRVETVPDSPQRGFELALYYAITHDEARGREAVRWATAHRCDRQQIPLIGDWCRRFLTDDDLRSLNLRWCGGPALSYRDMAFNAIAFGDGPFTAEALPPNVARNALDNPRDLYALCEYLVAVRFVNHADLREQDAPFFRLLPKEFLLSLKPDQIEHPDWMAHIAALALVAVDPNLEASQFLQGWAMEENQTITDGPGVAYEFLWADPYLPGVAYRNLDPWTYDPAGRLFARVDWYANSCWISIDSAGIRQENCSPEVQTTKQTFGSLTLIPMLAPCVEVPARANRESMILWHVKAGQTIAYRGEGKKDVVTTADPAGMWLVPENANNKVCQQRVKP